MGTESYLALIHGKVGNTTAELKQLLPWVAVLPVLPDRIVHRLLGQVVLEFEGQDGQAVDEQTDVQRPLGFIAAIVQLAGGGEAVLPEALLGLLVPK